MGLSKKGHGLAPNHAPNSDSPIVIIVIGKMPLFIEIQTTIQWIEAYQWYFQCLDDTRLSSKCDDPSWIDPFLEIVASPDVPL